MDPNACLERIKSAREDLMDAVDRAVWPHEDDRAQAMERAGEELAGAIEDLDEWLRKGGFLPSAWVPAEVTEDVSRALIWSTRTIADSPGDHDDEAYALINRVAARYGLGRVA